MYVDTDAVRWFPQVADGMTVTEVSELERVTQSGVSRALARLEIEVGTPLLRRSGRTLRMTHAGSAFKRHVDAMLFQLDDSLAAVNQLIEPETERCRWPSSFRWAHGWFLTLSAASALIIRSEEHTSELQSRQYLVCR